MTITKKVYYSAAGRDFPTYAEARSYHGRVLRAKRLRSFVDAVFNKSVTYNHVQIVDILLDNIDDLVPVFIPSKPKKPAGESK